MAGFGRKGGGRRVVCLLAVLLVSGAALAAGASADFPYNPGGSTHDYGQFHLAPGATPNDLSGDLVWKYAATPEPGNEPVNSQAQELNGIRGAHVVDADPSVATAWTKTTGRPDVAIAVLDSGIEWNNAEAMTDLRRKIRLNQGELPIPHHDRATALVPGVSCSSYSSTYDANGDGVVNVDDYACDARVSVADPRRKGPAGVLTPQDLILAFGDCQIVNHLVKQCVAGRQFDNDHNGYANDIAGWNFLDDNNDPYDDVRYGHGTGEALDSNAEANNGGGLGSCPNCMVMPLRVGDSFVADSNRFAAAATYAVDSGALVIQEALGAVNNTSFARDAVDYAYRHGVAVIASAADEAAQHHNYPSNLPHTIVVNSVTKYNDPATPVPRSYLQFTGCTNFTSKLDVSIPSVSCSSEATGRGAGMAGLIYSAALDAHEAGRLQANGACRRVDGSACVLSANEVRQLMASGIVDGTAQADDVNFAGPLEPSCSPSPLPGCTDPMGALETLVSANRPVVSPLATSRSYPARRGHDQFYGYGRVNAANAVTALLPASGPSRVPPEVEISSPDWYAQTDPTKSSLGIGAQINARGTPYTCTVEVAPGSYPNNALTSDSPPGDFAPVASSWCDGHTQHTTAFDGNVANVDIAALRSRFPSDAGNFSGPLPPAYAQLGNGRPNSDPYGFTVRIEATTGTPGQPAGPLGVPPATPGSALVGQDRRNLYLHRDAEMLPGFPRRLPSDGESSPLLVDLNADNRNELVYATADGVVHAQRPDGSELPGWPVRTDPLRLHTGAHAFTSGEMTSHVSGAVVGALAAGDLNHDGEIDVVANDLEGKVYAWSSRGRRVLTAESNRNYSGAALQPNVSVRQPTTGRTHHGFLNAPVLADLEGSGRLDVIAASLDRHVYAWRPDGRPLKGYPIEVVDPSKVASIDPVTHSVTFKSGVGAVYNQGAIIDTPAVGAVSGDGHPEIVVGTNEEYAVGADGGFNAGNVNTASLGAIGSTGLLSPANDRLYVLRRQGTAARGGAIAAGWPFKVASVGAQLLPVVGEGITGSPIIAPITCPSGGSGLKIGVMPAAGAAYVLNGNGSSCYGNDPSNGKPIALASDAAVSAQRRDVPAIPVVGEPAFGSFQNGVAFVGPAAGAIRALDLAANEYQGGQDFIGAWNAGSGQFEQGFPAAVNDLQFLTGPSIADITGSGAQDVIGGTSSLDLDAVSASSGLPVGGWPKFSAGWMIANPTIGSFGSLDSNAGATKVVIAMTRDGVLFAYRTPAPACSPSSWPRFHHDNANSGNLTRDATLPGKPFSVSLRGRRLSFDAPGNDLMCGTASRYEVVTSNRRITAPAFVRGRPLGGATAPAKPGSGQALVLSGPLDRYVAIRAIGQSGNVGPPAAVDRGARASRRGRHRHARHAARHGSKPRFTG